MPHLHKITSLYWKNAPLPPPKYFSQMESIISTLVRCFCQKSIVYLTAKAKTVDKPGICASFFLTLEKGVQNEEKNPKIGTKTADNLAI